METNSGIAQGLGGRYATALFGLAVEGKSVDAVSASLATLKTALADSVDLKTLTTSPLVTRKAGTEAILSVAKAMQLDPLTSNFLGVLGHNRRLAQLPAIIRDFNALAANRRGEQTAQVTSAHPLSGAQQAALKAKLKAALKTDVALELTVDPSILGGLIVRTGSRMIDSSLKTRLESLGQALKG